METILSVRPCNGTSASGSEADQPEFTRTLGWIRKMVLVDGDHVLSIETDQGDIVRVYGTFLCPCLEAFLELLGSNALLAPTKTRVIKPCCIDGSHERCPLYPDACPRVLHFFQGFDDDIEIR